MAPSSTRAARQRREAEIDYGMFSVQGNQMVQTLVAKVAEKATSEEDPTPTKAARLLNSGRVRIAEKGHAEVWDTAVREAIYDRLTTLIAAQKNITDLEADQIVDRIYAKAGSR